MGQGKHDSLTFGVKSDEIREAELRAGGVEYPKIIDHLFRSAA